MVLHFKRSFLEFLSKPGAMLNASSVFRGKVYKLYNIPIFLPFLSDLINERKETVLRSLREAENKAIEAAERLELAKKNYSLAESKEKMIRSQGEKSCILAKEALYESLAADLSRIDQSTSFTLRLKQKEYSLDLYNKLLDSSFEFATKTFSKYLTNKRYKKKKFFKKIERLYRMRPPV